jgi:phosphate transport system substrate-binding protein
MSRRTTLLGTAALVALAVAGTACSKNASGSGGVLRVSGSSTVNPVAADAAETLRATGLKITVDTQGGSSGGITQLGEGQIEVAMSSRELTDEDRAKHADVDFVATEIGQDAVGIVVRREVVDGGLKSVTRAQLTLIFEGKVGNWKQLGGPDLPVFVYDKEPGRGTREVLDKFLYGKGVKAPPPPDSDRYAIVGGNEETRTKLLSTPGSVGPLSSSFINGYPALAALEVEGIAPTPENVKNSTYPLSRPLFLVTDGAPSGDAKRFIDFVLSTEGQALVTKHGYLTLAELGLA